MDPDPDLDLERGLKWIRIRPNAVDPGGSRSGSETLYMIMTNLCSWRQGQARKWQGQGWGLRRVRKQRLKKESVVESMNDITTDTTTERS